MSELLRKIVNGEGVRQDFKLRIEDKQKIARTLAAFANTEGGSLLIGVKDNGKVRGVNPEEEFYMIQAAAEEFCDPPVNFESQVWQEEHHLVLEILVDKSEKKHKALDDDGKLKFFVRVDDHTLQANKILLGVWRLKMHGQRKPAVFDDETLKLIANVRENGPLTLSKIYRTTDLSMNQIDKLLSQLVYWDVVVMTMTESSTLYSV